MFMCEYTNPLATTATSSSQAIKLPSSVCIRLQTRCVDLSDYGVTYEEGNEGDEARTQGHG